MLANFMQQRARHTQNWTERLIWILDCFNGIILGSANFESLNNYTISPLTDDRFFNATHWQLE